MAEKEKTKQNMLTYKGKPLVRNGNTIYYGSMADPFVAMLLVEDTQQYSDLQMPQRVMVQILSTDSELRPKERIKKKTEKKSLYEALQIASIWLERMLRDAQ